MKEGKQHAHSHAHFHLKTGIMYNNVIISMFQQIKINSFRKIDF